MKFLDKICEKPWNSHYFKAPGWFSKYPTMLTAEEMRMLSWLAAHSDKAGNIIDLGSFLGGSTVSLAHGVRTSGQPRQVHAYDQFLFDERAKYLFLYRKGYGYVDGQDSFPVFERFTKDYKDLIVPHRGDVQKEDCPAGDISILFVDVSKTWKLNDYILRTFFTRLRAGAIIVQQDFLYFRNPWLYSTMWKLRDKVQLLSHAADHSVIFGVRRDLSEADVTPCLHAHTTRAEIESAIVETKKSFPDLRQREMIDALLAAYRSRPNATGSWEFPNVAKLPFGMSDD